MHPQLEQVADEFRAAQAHLHRAVAELRDDEWKQRPGDGRWSVAEIVEHLDLTGDAFLPGIRGAIERGRAQSQERTRARYSRDFMGWLLWRIMPPPVRLRVKAAASFVPVGNATPADLLARFDALQAEQLACVEAADGLDLERLVVQSPFAARVKYNLYSCLSILPRHQERHIWQAEQAIRWLRGV